jgi:iron complex outermembrane receptor protein
MKFETETDLGGEFKFAGIPAGRYNLRAIGKCKNTVALCDPFVAAQQIDATADVSGLVMQLQYVNLSEEVVMIAADDAQPITEISKTVNVIDGQEMRDRADFALADTVRTIPGFRVQQLGGFGRTASIKSRGLRNSDTALLLDGIRFRDPGSITGDATPFLSDFTLTSVSRIEVLRGSGSSLYGTNAVGGTIDFQTPVARRGIHGQVSAAGGGLGFGRFRGNLAYGVPSERFGINAALSRTAYTKGIDGEDNAGNTNFQSRLDYKPTSKTDLSGRFFVSDANVRLNVSPDTFGTLPPAGTIIDARDGINFLHDQNDPDSIQDSRFFSGQFSATQAINDQFVMGGYFQSLVTKRTNEDGLLGPGFQSEFTSSFGGTIHTGNVHATWTPNGANTFTGGYEFESERFRNEGATPSFSEGSGGVDSFWTRANQRSHTLYAQHRVGLLDGDLQFAGGVRAQWFSLGTPAFSSPDSPYAGFVLDAFP